jgi:hypothetical protein
MLMTSPSSADGSLGSELRHELGWLEDEAAAAGWVWDGPLSHQIDRLLVVLETGRL